MTPTTDSHMHQTMRRQPAELRRLLAADGEGWAQATAAAEKLSGARRVIVTGIGTSYHAALVGAWLLREAGLDARAVLSTDVALYPDNVAVTGEDAVIVMAHTGVKSHSGQAIAHAAKVGATALSVGSLSAEHSGSSLILRTVERETSAAYTASHLAAMTVLAQVATVVGERANRSPTDGYRAALASLPDHVAAVLDREAEIAPIAQTATTVRVYAAGAGPNEATALELVIKAREAAYGWVDALALEQFLHGPIVAFNAGDLAVVTNVPGAGAERTGEVCQVLAAMGGTLWVVGQPVAALADNPAVTTFALPGLDALPEALTPLLAVIPMQMLAYQMAAIKGINPDTFRRDDERYKAAFGLLKL